MSRTKTNKIISQKRLYSSGKLRKKYIEKFRIQSQDEMGTACKIYFFSNQLHKVQITLYFNWKVCDRWPTNADGKVVCIKTTLESTRNHKDH